MKKTLITLTILFGFIFAENPTLNVQGVLRDQVGAAVSDAENYQLTFYLYELAVGGSSIWNEEHTGVSVINGVYSAELGGVSSLGGLAFNVPYYLGIAVNGGAESTPRIPLSMSPYALSVRGTTNTFPNDGGVGIGTATPGSKLHVVNTGGTTAKFEASAGTNSLVLKTSNGGSNVGSSLIFNDNNNEHAKIQSVCNGQLRFSTNGTERMSIDQNGEAHLNSYWHFQNTNELNTDGTMFLNHGGNDVDISHGGGTTTTGGNLEVAGELTVGGGTSLGKIQVGTVGDGTPSNAGRTGTVNFPSPYSSPPMVFLQVLELDNSGSTSARVIDVTSESFTWVSYNLVTSVNVDQINWLAIGQ